MTQRSSHLSNGPISLTPCLLLDEPCMQANIARMGDHLQPHDVVVRPHVKTVKSLPVIERMTRSSREARLTVSTLREATEVRVGASYPSPSPQPGP